MTRLGYVLVTTALAELFGGLFVTVALLAPHPRFVWNATASAPIGLYRLTAIDRPVVGDLVAVMPPPALARFLDERRYLALGVPLLKHVAARSGATVCRASARVTVDGRVVAIARTSDSHGRALPVWRGCRVLRAHDLFLLNAVPDSMDGRYFGPLSSDRLLGRATPLFTRGAADTSFHWRGTDAPNAALHQP